jgi:hypothetical protein
MHVKQVSTRTLIGRASANSNILQSKYTECKTTAVWALKVLEGCFVLRRFATGAKLPAHTEQEAV